ncbi:MAG: hypothetical protein OEV94_10975 [Deltaproteobacteria bacterium]|nr:hypothetical protein [Deltaproteobacteria bacterium]
MPPKKPTPSAKPGPKKSAAPTPATDGDQISLFASEPSPQERPKAKPVPPPPALSEPPPERTGPQVTQLGVNAKGYWKVTGQGKPVALEEEDWIKELSRALNPKSSERGN